MRLASNSTSPAMEVDALVDALIFQYATFPSGITCFAS